MLGLCLKLLPMVMLATSLALAAGTDVFPPGSVGALLPVRVSQPASSRPAVSSPEPPKRGANPWPKRRSPSAASPTRPDAVAGRRGETSAKCQRRSRGRPRPGQRCAPGKFVVGISEKSIYVELYTI